MLELPSDILTKEIFPYLDIASISSLNQTNKKMNKLTNRLLEKAKNTDKWRNKMMVQLFLEEDDHNLTFSDLYNFSKENKIFRKDILAVISNPKNTEMILDIFHSALMLDEIYLPDNFQSELIIFRLHQLERTLKPSEMLQVLSQGLDDNSTLLDDLKLLANTDETLIHHQNFDDLERKDQEGNTPIILAVQKNNYDLVQELLKKGSNINAQNRTGLTALHYAARGDKKILHLLLENGAKSSLAEHDTPLEYMLRLSDKKESKDFTQKVEALLKSTRESPRKDAALFLTESPEIITLLLKYGYDINQSDNHGVTLLMDAAIEGEEEKIKLLLTLGANKKIKNQKGQTAYDLAKENKHISVTKLLK